MRSIDRYPSLPRTYQAFEAAWHSNVKEADGRDKSIDEGEVLANQQGDELSAAVLKFAESAGSAKDSDSWTFAIEAKTTRRGRRKAKAKSDIKPPVGN